MPRVTALRRKKFWNAAEQGTGLVSAPLFYRAARIIFTVTRISLPLCAPLKRSILTAPLRFPSANAAVKATPYGKAGADRYLLRHETADCAHYAKLHPAELSAQNRQNCLYTLKELGYQAGAGFMVGSPYQTAENLADDLMFLQKLRPQMIGIGPFIPHHDTPFKDEPAGSVELTLVLLAVLRLYFRTCFFRQQRHLALWLRAAGFWELRPVQTLLCPIFRRRTYAANIFVRQQTAHRCRSSRSAE